MDNPVTAADIAARWRPLTEAEAAVATTLIGDAWALLIALNAAPSLPADLDSGAVSVAQVTRVIAAMVLRVMRNPDGKSAEAIDDYSWSRAAAVADGSLYVSADELASLAGSVPALNVSAFTVRAVGQPRAIFPGRDGCPPVVVPLTPLPPLSGWPYVG